MTDVVDLGLIIETALAVVGWALWAHESRKRVAAEDRAASWEFEAARQEKRADDLFLDRRRSGVSYQREGYAGFRSVEQLTGRAR